jgi:FAD/FMN-containing dehydrogenase
VLPHASGDAGVARVFELAREADGVPMLCVVKDMGDEGVGRISFSRPGITLNVDLPVRDGTQRVVDRLNEHVIREGGRIYLAKDALTRAEHFRAMEPRLPAWNELRRKWDPEGRLRSALSVRLLGDEA